MQTAASFSLSRGKMQHRKLVLPQKQKLSSLETFYIINQSEITLSVEDTIVEPNLEVLNRLFTRKINYEELLEIFWDNSWGIWIINSSIFFVTSLGETGSKGGSPIFKNTVLPFSQNVIPFLRHFNDIESELSSLKSALLQSIIKLNETQEALDNKNSKYLFFNKKRIQVLRKLKGKVSNLLAEKEDITLRINAIQKEIEEAFAAEEEAKTIKLKEQEELQIVVNNARAAARQAANEAQSASTLAQQAAYQATISVNTEKELKKLKIHLQELPYDLFLKILEVILKDLPIPVIPDTDIHFSYDSNGSVYSNSIEQNVNYFQKKLDEFGLNPTAEQMRFLYPNFITDSTHDIIKDLIKDDENKFEFCSTNIVPRESCMNQLLMRLYHVQTPDFIESFRKDFYNIIQHVHKRFKQYRTNENVESLLITVNWGKGYAFYFKIKYASINNAADVCTLWKNDALKKEQNMIKGLSTRKIHPHQILQPDLERDVLEKWLCDHINYCFAFSKTLNFKEKLHIHSIEYNFTLKTQAAVGGGNIKRLFHKYC